MKTRVLNLDQLTVQSFATSHSFTTSVGDQPIGDVETGCVSGCETGCGFDHVVC